MIGRMIPAGYRTGFQIFLSLNYLLSLLSPEWGNMSFLSLIYYLGSKMKQNMILFAHPDFFFNPTTYRHLPCCEKLLKLSLLTFVHWNTRKIVKKKKKSVRSYFFFPNPVELNSVSERLLLNYIVRCCSFPCETGSPLPNMHGVFVPCYA